MRPFTIERATDPAMALRLAAPGDAHVSAPAYYLAGGTTLLDLMKLDVMRPAALIDINPLRREHGGINADVTGLRLGALVRMSVAADHPALRRDYPVLSGALWQAASAQLRNMASHLF